MSIPGTAQTRDEIRTAFAVEDLDVFRTANGVPYAIVGHNPDNR